MWKKGKLSSWDRLILPASEVSDREGGGWEKRQTYILLHWAQRFTQSLTTACSVWVHRSACECACVYVHPYACMWVHVSAHQCVWVTFIVLHPPHWLHEVWKVTKLFYSKSVGAQILSIIIGRGVDHRLYMRTGATECDVTQTSTKWCQFSCQYRHHQVGTTNCQKGGIGPS